MCTFYGAYLERMTILYPLTFLLVYFAIFFSIALSVPMSFSRLLYPSGHNSLYIAVIYPFAQTGFYICYCPSSQPCIQFLT